MFVVSLCACLSILELLNLTCCDAFCTARTSAISASPTLPRVLLTELQGKTDSVWERTVYNEEEQDVTDSECPQGYYLNSVENSCTPLGPLGRLSQTVETLGPFRKAYSAICNLFGVDTKQVSSLGVPFALSYAVLSQINGALTFSMAWYMTCSRTGLSPLMQGQWKSMLASYGYLYGFITLLRPFRVAAAVAMSKLSKEFLSKTQEKLNCGRGTAIAFQYTLSWVMWFVLTAAGVTIASIATGVPVLASSR